MSEVEKYVKTLEEFSEHLKEDLSRALSEVEKIRRERESDRVIIEQLISRVDQISRKIDKMAIEPEEERKRGRAKRRLNYEKFIEEKLMGRESFTLKEIKEEFKLPKFKLYALAEKIRKEYADKFEVIKDKEGMRFKALPPLLGV